MYYQPGDLLILTEEWQKDVPNDNYYCYIAEVDERFYNYCEFDNNRKVPHFQARESTLSPYKLMTDIFRGTK